MRQIKAQDIFISLLCVALCNNKITNQLVDSINNNTVLDLFEFAKEQSMVDIIGDTLFSNKLMPEGEGANMFRQYMMLSLLKAEKQQYILDKISKAFEQNEICHIALKGAYIKKLYPKPSHRTSGDIDILVKQCDIKKAAMLLESLKLNNTFKGSHDWGFKTADGLYVELHFKLIEDDNKSGINTHTWSAECLLDVWDNATLSVGKRYEYEMSKEHLYFYHIAHMAKHFEHGGCGVKAFADLWLLINKLDLDTDLKYKLIKSAGLISFENAVINLTNSWFDGANKDSLSLELEQFIFGGGAYGTKENYVAIQQSKSGGKIKYALNRIFLPYDFLKIQFPILNKFKWLMPVFQVVRWFKRIFLFKRLPYIINEYKINKSTDNAEALLRKLGL